VTLATLARRRARPLACAVAASQLACYAWVPAGAGGALAPGARVALEVNDVGRVALAGTLAPSITRVEGTLVRAEGDQLVLALAGYSQIRGGYTQLTGDTVRLRREHLAAVQQRQLSRRRTLVAVGVGVAAVVAFVAGWNIAGRGTPPEDRGGGGGPDQ
jgi:hypothetical protein